MKSFIKAWFPEEPKELTVYWKLIDGKYKSAIKQDDEYRVVCTDGNCADMKSKTTRLLKQFSGDTKLVWAKR